MCVCIHVHGMFVRVSARCGGACVHVRVCVRLRACLHVFCSAGTSLPRPLVWTPRPAFSAWCLPSGANSPGLRPQPFSWSALALWVASPVDWVTAWPIRPGGLGPVGRVCPEAPSTLLCGPCLSVPWGEALWVLGAASSRSPPPPARQCGQFCVRSSCGCGPPFCVGTELWPEGPFTLGLPAAPAWSQAPRGCQDPRAWAQPAPAASPCPPGRAPSPWLPALLLLGAEPCPARRITAPAPVPWGPGWRSLGHASEAVVPQS